MKNGIILAGVALACSVMTGCGPHKEELHIYTWTDYIAEPVIKQFEEANNCRVIVDTFDSNEAMYAKLQAGSTGYDIIMPSSYQISVMVKNGMIQKLDHTKLPNVKKNFEKSYVSSILDPSFTYNVPYAVTYTIFVYRKDKIGNAPIDSWKIWNEASLKNRMSLLKDMRETIGGALKSLGYSLNSTNAEEIAKAADVVIGWKKNIAKFDNEQYKSAVASGEWYVGHGYSSDAIQIMLEDENIDFSFPKEGFTIAFDEMVIASDSKKVDLAHKFIDFCYTAEAAKANMEEVYAPMPVAPALAALDPKLKPLLVFEPSILKRGEVLRDFDDQPAVRDLYIKAWDRIMAADKN